jgi:hypothetical protein
VKRAPASGTTSREVTTRPRARGLLCHALAVATGLLTYVGTLVIEGVARGDLTRALGREAWDMSAYWYFGLPVCYLVAGLLGYLGRRRGWRWSLDMLATHSVCALLLAAGSLDLWGPAVVSALMMSLPGILTGWLGSLVYRLGAAPQRARRWPVGAPAARPFRSGNRDRDRAKS